MASVVIPTYNRSELLGRTLRSLARQQGVDHSAFEVVVADDGSSEDIAAVCAPFRERFAITRVRQERNGFRAAAARNLGARAARSELLIFLDCGTLAGPGLVAGHLAAHATPLAGDLPKWRSFFAPTFGYDVGPEAVNAVRAAFLDETDPEPHQPLLHLPGMRDYRDGKLAEINYELASLAVPWRFFWSRNISVPRAAFDEVGGFHEGFHEYGVEDIEFGYRLHRAGIPFGWAATGWGYEVPVHDEDKEGRAAANRRNLGRLVRMYADIEVEFYVTNRPTPRDEQTEFNALTAWRSTLPVERTEDLIAEFGDVTTPALVIGAGAGFGERPAGTVVGLDPNGPVRADAWDHVEAGDVLSGWGFRTGFREGQFRSVVLTRRLAGMWPRWADFIRAEAARVGEVVYVSSALRGDELACTS